MSSATCPRCGATVELPDVLPTGFVHEHDGTHSIMDAETAEEWSKVPVT